MTTGAEQLPLPFEDAPDYAAADFVASTSNEAVLAWLARDDWPERRLAIWGPEGCGKTHLVHLWSRQHGGVLLIGPAMDDLATIPEGGCLAIDDADRITNEKLLLHVLNTARDRGLQVLLAGRSAPARWPVALPDLSSRLRAFNTAEITAPDDDLLRLLLVRVLSDRQLEIPGPAQAWLLRHLPRSAAAILSAVKRLDAESLLQRKPITRAFAARVLGTDLTDEVSMLKPGPDIGPSPSASDER